MTLLETLSKFCEQHGLNHTYWVAYSGGLDSHVLLEQCVLLRQSLPLKLQVVHVHHGLSTHADQWVAHCENVCKAYDVPCMTKKIIVQKNIGDSLEDVARQYRYQIFAEILQYNDCLLTAHHQDDQAETILLQLIRGAGPKGLASMPLIKPFANGFHARPFIQCSRSVLYDYAKQNQLVWIEDEMNQHLKLTRNFIRHEVMPILKNRWSNVEAQLSRSARHCAEQDVLINAFSLELLREAKGSKEHCLSVQKLLSLSDEKQKLVLRSWIDQQGHPLPDSKKLESICHQMLTARSDKNPHVRFGKSEVRRYRDDLYLMNQLPKYDETSYYELDLEKPLSIAGIGILRASLVKGRGLRVDREQIECRFRQGGEQIEIPSIGRRPLKKLFQEWGVLPWERDRTPLLFIGDQLIAVVGYFLKAELMARENEMGYELILDRIV